MALVLDGTLGIAVTGDNTITQNFTIPQNLGVGTSADGNRFNTYIMNN
jgi:hypothetical protein